MIIQELDRLINSDAEDLKELAVICGYDYREFYAHIVLRNVDLSGTDLRGIKVAGFDLKTVKFDEETIFDPVLHENTIVAISAKKNGSLWMELYDRMIASTIVWRASHYPAMMPYAIYDAAHVLTDTCVNNEQRELLANYFESVPAESEHLMLFRLLENEILLQIRPAHQAYEKVQECIEKYKDNLRFYDQLVDALMRLGESKRAVLTAEYALNAEYKDDRYMSYLMLLLSVGYEDILFDKLRKLPPKIIKEAVYKELMEMHNIVDLPILKQAMRIVEESMPLAKVEQYKNSSPKSTNMNQMINEMRMRRIADSLSEFEVVP